jgi:hypothetical protein
VDGQADQVAAAIVADLVAARAQVEGGGLHALAGDQVDVDRRTPGERRQQQLDRREVRVVT